MGVWIAAGVVAVVVVWAIATFNRFVRIRQHLRESWADIDVELKRRHELIPNLVETVRGYMSYERDVLERVVALRNRAVDNHGDPAQRAGDESQLMVGLKQLFAVVEGYPELKANRQFLDLQRQLALTEDRIAAARRFYNGNVRDLSVLRESFPSVFIGSMMSVTVPSYFELGSEAERVIPRVDV